MLPIFLSEQKNREIFQEIVEAIPQDTKVFLISGTVRNALMYKFFGEKKSQRDFDLLVIGDRDSFIENLKEIGFSYGSIHREHEIVVKKKKIPRPIKMSDYIYLDIHSSDLKTVADNLSEYANFTINGSALPLKNIFSDDWFKTIISIPGTMTDLKGKHLRVNKPSSPSGLFACVRFMSQGFAKPNQHDIDVLLDHFLQIGSDNFDRRIKKVFDSVGNKKKALELVWQLGIKFDIFDFSELAKYRKNKK